MWSIHSSSSRIHPLPIQILRPRRRSIDKVPVPVVPPRKRRTFAHNIVSRLHPLIGETLTCEGRRRTSIYGCAVRGTVNDRRTRNTPGHMISDLRGSGPPLSARAALDRSALSACKMPVFGYDTMHITYVRRKTESGQTNSQSEFERTDRPRSSSDGRPLYLARVGHDALFFVLWARGRENRVTIGVLNMSE